MRSRLQTVSGGFFPLQLYTLKNSCNNNKKASVSLFSASYIHLLKKILYNSLICFPCQTGWIFNNKLNTKLPPGTETEYQPLKVWLTFGGSLRRKVISTPFLYTLTLFIKHAGSTADNLRLVPIVVPRCRLVEMTWAISWVKVFLTINQIWQPYRSRVFPGSCVRFFKHYFCSIAIQWIYWEVNSRGSDLTPRRCPTFLNAAVHD